jgi:hypothetical protein
MSDGKKTVMVIQGHNISGRDEMLSLTDLWKAAGGEKQQEPSRWLDLPTAKEFIDHIGASVNAGLSGISLVTTMRGKNGGTMAHWQIAMAYAKYLSPAFHAHVNETYRSVTMPAAAPVPTITSDLHEMVTRSFGIDKMTIHKVTNIEKAVETILVLANQISAQNTLGLQQELAAARQDRQAMIQKMDTLTSMVKALAKTKRKAAAEPAAQMAQLRIEVVSVDGTPTLKVVK